MKCLITNHSNAFVAKLYNRSSIPRNHIQCIIEDSIFLINSHFSILKEKVVSTLNTFDSDDKIVKDITSMFYCLENPFHYLINEYQRIAYFKLSGNYIAPVQYLIGKRKVRKNTASFIAEKIKDVYGYFIPLRQVLQKFFELPDTFTVTMYYINSFKESDSIKNFIQSKFWHQKKKSFGDNAFVLLFVYYDDWQTNIKILLCCSWRSILLCTVFAT